MEGFAVFVVLIVFLVVAILKLGIKIVSQSEIMIIERLGRFHRCLMADFMS